MSFWKSKVSYACDQLPKVLHLCNRNITKSRNWFTKLAAIDSVRSSSYASRRNGKLVMEGRYAYCERPMDVMQLATENRVSLMLVPGHTNTKKNMMWWMNVQSKAQKCISLDQIYTRRNFNTGK